MFLHFGFATGLDRGSFATISTLHSKPKIFEMPFELKGSLILVEAGMDGVKGKYVLDTGANVTLVNRKYCSKLGQAHNRRSYGFNGSISNVSTSHSRFEWAGYTLPWVEINILDLTHLEKALQTNIHGFIGYDILRRFVMVIDYERQLIKLHDRSKKGMSNEVLWRGREPDQIVDFRLNRHIPCLKIYANGYTFWAGVDSGAAMSLLDRNTAKQIRMQMKYGKSVSVVGFGDAVKTSRVFKVTELDIGEMVVDPLDMIVQDITHLSELLAFEMEGVLGHNFLADFVLGIDYREKKLYLWKHGRERRPMVSTEQKNATIIPSMEVLK